MWTIKASDRSVLSPLAPKCSLLFLSILAAALIPCRTLGEPHDPNLTAVYEFGVVLEEDPNNLEALRARGSIFRALELYDNALADLERADRLDPGDPEVIGEIGICHYNLGEREQATSRMDRAVKLLEEKIAANEWPVEKYAPVERELREYRFLNFRDQERFEEALAEIRELENYLSGKLSFLCDMGNLLFKLGRASEALALYGKAVEANPAFERYCVGAANCCLLLGRPGEALEYFRTWAVEEPDSGLPYLHEAFIRINYLKDAEGAHAALARAEAAFHARIDGEEEPDLEEVIHLSRVLQTGGRYQESWDLLEGLIDDFRGHWLVVHLQGVNAAALGKEREALSFERESKLYKRLNPGDWLQAYELIPPVEPAAEATPASEEGPPSEGAWMLHLVPPVFIVLLFWLTSRLRKRARFAG